MSYNNGKVSEKKYKELGSVERILSKSNANWH